MEPKTAKLVGTISLVLNVILLLLVTIFGYMLIRGRGTAPAAGYAIATDMSKMLLEEPSCVAISSTDALLIIDVQNDFMPSRLLTSSAVVQAGNLESDAKTIKDGSLKVDSSKDITSHINKLVEVFEKNGNVIYSLDWHPSDHCSFDSSNNPAKVTKGDSTGICRDETSLKAYNDGKLMRWPNHCVQGNFGAQLDPNLRIAPNGIAIKKGFWKDFDSYSAFGGLASSTQLPESSWTIEDMTKADRLLVNVLMEKKIERVFIVGIATEYCVKHSVEDAVKEAMGTAGIKAIVVVQEAIAGLHPDQQPGIFGNWKASGVALLSENNKDGKPRFAEKC